MNLMHNKTTVKHHIKKQFEYPVISLIAAFAILTSLTLSTTYSAFAYVPNTPEESGCNPETDTDCFPDEIFTSGHSNDANQLVLKTQFLGADTEAEESEVIEMEEIVVKGCEGGTKGEVPGKPGVCNE